jgi:hypothetical protein
VSKWSEKAENCAVRREATAKIRPSQNESEEQKKFYNIRTTPPQSSTPTKFIA